MKSGFYHAIGKISYWFAILAGLYSIFLLSWKIFGHSPELNAVLISLVVTNIGATTIFAYKAGKLTGEIKHSVKYMDSRFDGVDKRFSYIDGRFDAADKRFDAVDRRFGELMRELRDLRRDSKEHLLSHKSSG